MIDIIIARQFHRLFLLGFLLIVPAFTHAATYYVDAASGNDANNGTTISTPWKSISKVNGGKFEPGDYILFKRGCTWREQLIIPSSGTAGNPITFGAYGSGAKPVISGADIVGAGGWTLYSGKIYVTNVSGITSAPNQLYVDGTFYDIAHYPNNGYLLATANSPDTTSIIDSDLTLTPDQVVGTTVMTRAVPWYISTSIATAYDPSSHTITLNAPVYDASLVMRTGYGFYLRNMLWMLDSPKEWYYDPATGRLYLWTAGGDIPGRHRVEISNRGYGVLISVKNYITIRDLAITAAKGNNVYISAANKVLIDNLDISGGQNGIYLINTSDSTIQNNYVRDTLSTAIHAAWNQKNNVHILNNVINNSGNVGAGPNGSLAGISVSGTSTNVKNNLVTNSGYIGIRIEGSNIAVQNNVIDKSCLVLDDCSGIYTNGRNAGDINKSIIGNTLTNSIGNLNGTPNTITRAHGIYLDDGGHDSSVVNNIISNTEMGIFIPNGHNNTVTGNTVYSTRTYGLLINESGIQATSPGVVHDNVLTGNTFETISTGATAYYYSTIEATTNFGTYDNNRYCHPNSVYVVKNQNVNYNLLAWQQTSGQDLNSTDTKSLCTALPPTVTLTATPATVPYGGSVTLTWSSTNAISCTASGGWSGMKAASSSLEMTNITARKTFKLTCSGRGGKTTRSVTVNVK